MTFQWYQAGNPIAGATHRHLFIPNVPATGAGHYVLVASNAFGQVSSPAMEVVINPIPAPISLVGAWGTIRSGNARCLPD